jgi:hypothetical protein
MLFRKLKEGPVSDSDGATGAHRLVGARPVEHGCGSYFGSVKKNPTAHGGQGGPAPSCCLPTGGERVTLAISTPDQKTRKGFPMKIEIFSYDTRFFLNTPPFTMIAAAPEGSPPRRISNKQFKKNPCPPCLGEALRRCSIVYITIFMVFCANTLSMPVSTEPNL